MRRHVGAVAAEIATDGLSLGSRSGEQDDGGEGEVGQDFHDVFWFEARFAVSAALATGFSFAHSNSLHPLHRKRLSASYNDVSPASESRACGQFARLLTPFFQRTIFRTVMKAKANGHRSRIELGRHIVADPGICGGQPTFKGTRILVWVVLDQLERGLTWDEIVREWDGKISKDAISEAIAVAHLVVKHEPFRSFHAGSPRRTIRQGEVVAS